MGNTVVNYLPWSPSDEIQKKEEVPLKETLNRYTVDVLTTEVVNNLSKDIIYEYNGKSVDKVIRMFKDNYFIDQDLKKFIVSVLNSGILDVSGYEFFIIKYNGKSVFVLLNSPMKYDYKGDASYFYNYDLHNKIYWLFKSKNFPPNIGKSQILTIDRIFPTKSLL